MSSAFDLIVIGAGPAGGAAALAAAHQGLSVALIDESEAAGGQVYCAPAAALEIPLAKQDDDFRAGEELRVALAASTVQHYFGRRVWAVTPDFRVETVYETGPQAFVAPRVIAATGAYERIVPFAGWSLPGVIGLAAATILLKSQGMVPGRRVVVAGCGPLLASVAAKIVAAGGEIAAVVDLARPSDWLKAAPGLMRRPRLLRRGLGWALDIGRARVPVYFGHGVRKAEGSARVDSVVIGRVDRTGVPAGGADTSFDVDVLVVGHGLVPGAEVPRLLRADMSFDRLRGGWVPVVNGYGRTSIPGLFAVGDGAGIRGAEPAALAGEIAGLTVAHECGRMLHTHYLEAVRPLERQLASYRAFADGVASLMALRPAQVAAIAPDTIVCRCEDVTRGTIDLAARDGASDVNQLKHFTRCGMGPCQGRMCGDVAAELLAQARGASREAVGCWTGRPPLRPVPIEDLIGTFSYDDIPVPKPAPL